MVLAALNKGLLTRPAHALVLADGTLRLNDRPLPELSF